MGLAACLASALLLAWWATLPGLRVYVDPDLAFEVDWFAFRKAFLDAGVRKVEVLAMPRSEDVLAQDLGPWRRRMSVGLLSSRGRNPLLTAEDEKNGRTGPGSSAGRLAVVHPDELARFLGKHRASWPGTPEPDLVDVRRYLFTNTALHETWHAVTDSAAHNPVDREAVMFGDPAANAAELGSRFLSFRGGERQRLVELFAPVLPGGPDLQAR